MREPLRIAVLCTDDPQHQYLVRELEQRFGLAGVVLERNHSQIDRLWRRRLYVAWIYRRYHALRSRFTGRSRYRRAFFLPPTVASPKESSDAPWPPETVEVPWINGRAARAALAHWQPDTTVVCGTGIISRRTLDHTGLTINIHGGWLPEYRGNHGVFFAFREKCFDRIAGSLHLVIPELDRGPLLAVARPAVYPHDDDEALYCRSVEQAMSCLFELLEEMNAGTMLDPESVLRASVEQQSDGRTFRHRDRTPWLDLGLWLRRCLGRHRVPHLPESVTVYWRGDET